MTPGTVLEDAYWHSRWGVMYVVLGRESHQVRLFNLVTTKVERRTYHETTRGMRVVAWVDL